jgi:anaphase-promoting complex subunit 8
MFPGERYLSGRSNFKEEPNLTCLDWATAEKIWDHIRDTDPNRVDDIDQFSNMLFIMKKREKLFKLAHDYLNADQTRPEILSLIGGGIGMRRIPKLNRKLFRKLLQHAGRT